MNWLLVIKNFLGRFWGELFQDGDFLPGVEFLLSLYSKSAEWRFLNWRNGLIAENTSSMPSALPYPVLIDQAKIDTEWYSLDKLWDRDSGELLINGTYEGNDENSMGWVAPVEEAIKEPFMLKTHLYGETLTLVRGIDYDFSDGVFLFYVDLKALDIPTVMVTDKNGYPHILYKLFGVAEKEVKICDPVTGFESDWLNAYCDIVWDIHQNGATFYNTKQLLGKVSGSVICAEGGSVERIWQEQGYYCMEVGPRVYCSKEQANYEVGDSVKLGDVLFGTLKMFKGYELPKAAEIPGIKVMTDAGELTALNKLMDIVVDEESGTEILPLIGDGSIVQAYQQLCVKHAANKNCPSLKLANHYTSDDEGSDTGGDDTTPVTPGSLRPYIDAMLVLARFAGPHTETETQDGVIHYTQDIESNPLFDVFIESSDSPDDPDAPDDPDVDYDHINPYVFISSILRRGRAVTARMKADDVELAHAALDCIRKACCASGMMNVYLETSNNYEEEDQVAILNTASFMATAGMLAVAEVGTIGIKEAYAEAKLI